MTLKVIRDNLLVTFAPHFTKETAMILRSEGNRLFIENQEVCEYVGTHMSDGPAHHQKIACVGRSPKDARIISADATGQVKIWDPSRPNPEKRIWGGEGYKDTTAVGITDDGKRIAIAVGLTIGIYDVEQQHGKSKKIGDGLLPLNERITLLQFIDDEHITCHDSAGNKLVFERTPAWQIKK